MGRCGRALRPVRIPPFQAEWVLTAASDTSMPPLAVSARQLPSSHQLSHRLSQLAKAYDLNLSPDAMSDIGQFMAVGMDAHLGDLLHGIIHLTGRDRPGCDTIRVPHGIKREMTACRWIARILNKKKASSRNLISRHSIPSSLSPLDSTHKRHRLCTNSPRP